MRLIAEGLSLADYVTLYDHPDKYSAEYAFGETSKVMKTKSSHWRYTVSTCMTFATTVRMLKRDEAIWRRHLTGSHPHDHLIFSELEKKLAVCLPGRACHCDLTWGGMEAIEPWAVKMMLDLNMEMLRASSDVVTQCYQEMILLLNNSDIDKLKMCHAVLNY